MGIRKNKKANLTEGSIGKELIKLALPIMGTSFVQMTYNMMDMFWLGRVGSKAVAAVGTAGFFTWLAMAIIMIPKIGAEVGVAQSMGKEDVGSARGFVNHTVQLDLILALIYGLFLIVFRKNLIGFFNLGDEEVISMAINYLVIIAPGIIFFFMNPVLTGIMNGYGNSRTPFIINSIGLLVNMVLDPILIFGLGPVPSLGVRGAALATITAQLVVTLVFGYVIKNVSDMSLFKGFVLFKIPDLIIIKKIFKLGLPVSLQNAIFAILSMFIARIIANWGPIPIAVQKIGSQIESISWMTASGFSTALGAFVGQNYGADKWGRIYKGYFKAIGLVSIIGVAATCLLIFAAKPIFSMFIPESEAVRIGVDYLKILGLSQWFMTIEITTAGAFNGLGRTTTPALIGIIFNGLRIPGALFLSSTLALGLNGVWWSISISSVFKGIILVSLFIFLLYRSPEVQNWRNQDKAVKKAGL